jgi:hypothetical protein
MRRTLFLAALGPASALVSMTIVRLVLASNLVAPPPTRWPAPLALTAGTADSVGLADAPPHAR